MPRTRKLKPATRKEYDSIADLITTFQLLPSEQYEEIERLRQAIRSELAAGSPYEEWLAEDILIRMLEIMRIRRIRNTTLSDSWRRVVYNRLSLSLTSEMLDEEQVQYQEFAKELLKSNCNEEDTRYYNEVLAGKGTSLDRLHMEAYEDVSDEIERYDRRLDLLERRLRLSHEHFHSMRQLRIREERSREAEDIAS